MPCRPVLRCGPSSEPHAASSHALQPPHQLLQAAVCGEHRHRLLHHVCPHWPGHQRDSLSSGDKEEAFLELWQRGFHCAACGFCKQCQVRHGTAWHGMAQHGMSCACSLCSSVRPPQQHSMAWQWLVLLAVCCIEVLMIAQWPKSALICTLQLFVRIQQQSTLACCHLLLCLGQVLRRRIQGQLRMSAQTTAVSCFSQGATTFH